MTRMKIDWTLFLVSAFLIAGYFLRQSTDEFLQGAGYAAMLGCMVLAITYLVSFTRGYLKQRRSAPSTDA